MTTIEIKSGSAKSIGVVVPDSYPVDEYEFFAAIKTLNDTGEDDSDALFKLTGTNKNTTNNSFVFNISSDDSAKLTPGETYTTDIRIEKISDGTPYYNDDYIRFIVKRTNTKTGA